MGVSVGLELTGFVILFSATTLQYRILGGVLLAAGVIPWSLPSLREAIARERQRDVRNVSSQDVRARESHAAVEQGDEADKR
jgi:hypothetical protein